MFAKIKAWFKKAEEEVPELAAVPSFLHQMTSTLVSSLEGKAEAVLPIVIAAIKAAATNPSLSMAQKLVAVAYTVEQQCEGIAPSVINATVAAAYTTLAQDVNVKEVPDDTVPAPVPAPPPLPVLMIPPAIVAATGVAPIVSAPVDPAPPVVSAPVDPAPPVVSAAPASIPVPAPPTVSA
jgi:hypothetical protein